MTDKIKYLGMIDHDMAELGELVTLITHACNRHPPVHAIAVLNAVISKIMVDMNDAPNFNEFADHVLEGMVKAIEQLKEKP